MKAMTIKLDRSKVCKILLMCDDTAMHYAYAAALERSCEIRESIMRTKEMWDNIHDEIRQQLDEWDKKQEEKKRNE